MRYLLGVALSLVVFGCKNTPEPKELTAIQTVEIERIYEDSVSVRALEILDDGSVAFAGSNGKYGLYNPTTKVWNTAVMKRDSVTPSFRAVAHTAEDFFML
ncbi:MAG: oxidoreductase, partial [Bacteroidota bacterium]|nr:oxidoreductase [Bacteroidota bacterium]